MLLSLKKSQTQSNSRFHQVSCRSYKFVSLCINSVPKYFTRPMTETLHSLHSGTFTPRSCPEAISWFYWVPSSTTAFIIVLQFKEMYMHFTALGHTTSTSSSHLHRVLSYNNFKLFPPLLSLNFSQQVSRALVSPTSATCRPIGIFFFFFAATQRGSRPPHSWGF
jgi:hypothetical protein